MSQQTMNFGGAQVAEPPAPLLPESDLDAGGSANRRKLMFVGAGAGVLVLGITGFFLMNGGSPSNGNSGFVVPHHQVPAAAAARPVTPVTLPKRVVTPVGRDPFKALYTQPVSSGAGGAGSSGASASSTSTTSGPTTSSGATAPTTVTTGTTTSTSSTPTYKPVWIQLKSVSGSTATFIVGYSNGKTLKAVRFTVTASRTHAVSFGGSFALEAIRNGVATLMFGDGSPFQLDRIHNTMVVG